LGRSLLTMRARKRPARRLTKTICGRLAALFRPNRKLLSPCYAPARKCRWRG